MKTLLDILWTVRVYLRITCCIFTTACALYYGYYCYTGNALRLTVPVTLVATIDNVAITAGALPVSISQADPKVMARIERAAK